MTFETWWEQLTKAEQKVIGVGNAMFVWQECQKYTLMTIEDACKAQVAYDQGFKDARERFEVRIAGWTLTPGVRVQPAMRTSKRSRASLKPWS